MHGMGARVLGESIVVSGSLQLYVVLEGYSRQGVPEARRRHGSCKVDAKELLYTLLDLNLEHYDNICRVRLSSLDHEVQKFYKNTGRKFCQFLEEQSEKQANQKDVRMSVGRSFQRSLVAKGRLVDEWVLLKNI
jgi:hypothetical protein